MLLPADFALWLLTAVVEAFAVYLFWVQGLSRKFLLLSFYLLLCAIICAGRFAVFYQYGLTSSAYVYFYYYSDALLTVFLFLSICELSLRLARSKISRRRLALTGAVAFLVVFLFSASIASQSSMRMMSHFVIELSQNLYFASYLAIAALWVWKTFGDPEDRTAARFVGVVFGYISMFILLYGVRQLAPQVAFDHQFGQMMAVWLPIGCGFIAVSHEQRPNSKP